DHRLVAEHYTLLAASLIRDVQCEAPGGRPLERQAHIKGSSINGRSPEKLVRDGLGGREEGHLGAGCRRPVWRRNLEPQLLAIEIAAVVDREADAERVAIEHRDVHLERALRVYRIRSRRPQQRTGLSDPYALRRAKHILGTGRRVVRPGCPAALLGLAR